VARYSSGRTLSQEDWIPRRVELRDSPPQRTTPTSVGYSLAPLSKLPIDIDVNDTCDKCETRTKARERPLKVESRELSVAAAAPRFAVVYSLVSAGTANREKSDFGAQNSWFRERTVCPCVVDYRGESPALRDEGERASSAAPGDRNVERSSTANAKQQLRSGARGLLAEQVER
jgi:hypothetical protein